MQSVIKKMNLSTQIIDFIVSKIESGEWKPGDKLPNEIDLAKSLEVSRGIMREATKILENFGIIASRAGLGTIVTEDAFSCIHRMRFFEELKENAPISEIMQTRLIIEPELAYYACIHATDESIKELEQLYTDTANRIREEGVLLKDDFRFHRQIALLSGNATLYNLLCTLLDQLQKDIYSQFNHYAGIEQEEQSLEDHHQIIEAFKSANPKLARTVMRTHLKYRMDLIEDYNAE